MKLFSRSWKRSEKPSKQRKYIENAPLHIKRIFFNATLSKELRKKYKRRSFPVKKGDTVKVLVGDFKNKIGKINGTDRKRIKIYIDGIEKGRKDGTKVFIAIKPNNVMIQELNLDDKLRRRAIERNSSSDKKGGVK